MSRISIVTRRQFLEALGVGAGGLVLATYARPLAAKGAGEGAAGAFKPNVFISVAPSGTVSIIAHRSEMGQGVRTAMPMLIADEMGALWEKVEVVQGQGDAAYGSQNTDGSSSVRRGEYTRLRVFGATAREMLIAAAAKQWKVPAKQCVARDHAVVHLKSKRQKGYGELAAAAAKLPVPDAKKIKLRSKKELRYVGKSQPIVDGRAMTTGTANYGADITFPGMVTAVVARPPAVGAQVASMDADAALEVNGVIKVLKMPGKSTSLPTGFMPLGGVAVVAKHTYAALKGRKALKVEWGDSPHGSYDSSVFHQALEDAIQKPGKLVRKVGDAEAALSRAKKKLSAVYHTAHLAQAPMEPPAAVAKWNDGACEVWAPTQHPQLAQAQLAAALGIDAAKVTVNVTLLGGGFGRKSKPDFIIEAALLARELGKPVRVQWSREDDLRHGFFHSTSVQKLDAAIDGKGAVTGWRHRTAFPPIGATFAPMTKHGGAFEMAMGVTDVPFSIPNLQAESVEADAHVRIGWFRAVANNYHAFAIGSFVDEIAAAKGTDPREEWLSLLGKDRKLDPKKMGGVEEIPNYGEDQARHPIDTGRLRNVIEVVTERANWSRARKEKRAIGLAAHRSFASYVATVIEVEIVGDGEYRIERVHCALDCGLALHRDRVRSQIEGGVIFGLSLAAHSEITAKGGAIEQGNFDDYKVLRINETPRLIDPIVVENGPHPGGVGEPGVPAVAPALANAIFAGTGKRLRELPLSRAGWRLRDA